MSFLFAFVAFASIWYASEALQYSISFLKTNPSTSFASGIKFRPCYSGNFALAHLQADYRKENYTVIVTNFDKTGSLVSVQNVTVPNPMPELYFISYEWEFTCNGVGVNTVYFTSSFSNYFLKLQYTASSGITKKVYSKSDPAAKGGYLYLDSAPSVSTGTATDDQHKVLAYMGVSFNPGEFKFSWRLYNTTTGEFFGTPGSVTFTGYPGYGIEPVVDVLGNIYASISKKGAVLYKFDPSGNKVFNITLGQFYPKHLFLDPSNANFFIIGDADFALNGATYSGGYDIALLKYKSDGTLLWTKLYGISGDERVRGATVDANYLYVTGTRFPANQFLYVIDFNGNVASSVKDIYEGVPDYFWHQQIVVSSGNVYIWIEEIGIVGMTIPDPSATPTSAPTFAPSYLPTVTPTTASPSRTPTATPSTRPTTVPSYFPTALPTTSAPTAMPTTSTPTVTPTFRPTAIPTATPTAVPTMKPTKITPIVTFSFNVTIEGISDTNLSADEGDCILGAAALMLNVSEDYLTLNRHYHAINANAQSQSTPRKSSPRHRDALTLEAVQISIKAQIPTVEVGCSDPTLCYNTMVSTLKASATNHEFINTVKALAHEVGSTNFDSATVSEVSASPATIYTPPKSESSSSSSSELSTGALVGIIIGSVAGFILCCVLVYWFVIHRSSSQLSSVIPPENNTNKRESAPPKGANSAGAPNSAASYQLVDGDKENEYNL